MSKASFSASRKKTALAATAVGWHMCTHPVGWLPVTTAAASVIAPACMNAADYFYGTAGAASTAAIAAGAWLIAEERIDWSGVRRRWPAPWMVGSTAATAVGLYSPITDLLPWGAGDIIAASMAISAGLGIAWWHGLAERAGTTRDDVARDGLRWALDELGISSQTTISESQTSDRGDIEWIITLGHSDQDKLNRSTLAWKLDVEPARVLIRKAKSSSPRKFRVVLFKKSPGSLKSIAHPASIKSNIGPGGAWAPGARTVDMGAPLGPAVGSDQAAVINVYERDYGARHNLVSGMTGAGKSTLVSSIIAHGAASVDSVVVGVDLGKSGETFDDWTESGAVAYMLCADAEDNTEMVQAARQWLADLQWLNRETRRRVRLMKSSEVVDENGDKTRVWPASPEHPAIIYIIEEYATALANIRGLDGRLADAIEEETKSLGRAARAAGVSINIVTQRPTEDELPTSIRGQLNQTIAGRMKAGSDSGRLANRDVDLVGDLRAGKGLCYVDEDGSERPWMVKGFDLSKPKTCRQIADLYTDTQPSFTWGESVSNNHTAEESDEVDDLFDLDSDTDSAALAGVSITAAVDDDPEPDTAVDPDVIMDALRAAPDGLRRSDVEGLYGQSVSPATVLRALRRLRAEGRVIRQGRGSTTRYHQATQDDADGAADAA